MIADDTSNPHPVTDFIEGRSESFIVSYYSRVELQQACQTFGTHTIGRKDEMVRKLFDKAQTEVNGGGTRNQDTPVGGQGREIRGVRSRQPDERTQMVIELDKQLFKKKNRSTGAQVSGRLMEPMILNALVESFSRWTRSRRARMSTQREHFGVG